VRITKSVKRKPDQAANETAGHSTDIVNNWNLEYLTSDAHSNVLLGTAAKFSKTEADETIIDATEGNTAADSNTCDEQSNVDREIDQQAIGDVSDSHVEKMDCDLNGDNEASCSKPQVTKAFTETTETVAVGAPFEGEGNVDKMIEALQEGVLDQDERTGDDLVRVSKVVEVVDAEESGPLLLIDEEVGMQ
jgi:hypothetical protein